MTDGEDGDRKDPRAQSNLLGSLSRLRTDRQGASARRRRRRTRGRARPRDSRIVRHVVHCRKQADHPQTQLTSALQTRFSFGHQRIEYNHR
jgi:hypothetical protein